MPRTGIVDTLRAILKDDAKRTRDLAPRRVIGRNADGSEQVVKMDSECVEREPTGAHAKGQVIQLPAAPRFDTRGVAGVPFGSGVGGDLIHVESQSPKVLPAGATTSVTITGRGFYDGMSWEYLDADGVTINSDVTVASSTYGSSTSYTLSVTVSSTATAVTDLPIAYE